MRITVGDLMRPAGAVVLDTAPLIDARDQLLRSEAAEVFVVDATGRLRGVVPDYEFLKAELNALPSDTPILSLLSVKVETADLRDDIATVLPKFREAWCGRVAVTDRGRLVGRLGRCDALRLAATLRSVTAVTQLTVEAEPLSGPHFTADRSEHRRRNAAKPRRLRRIGA